MKILFLIFHGFNPASGVSKKIHYQVKALQECGIEVHFCYYDIKTDGRRRWLINDKEVYDLGYGEAAKIKKRVFFNPLVEYAVKHKIDFTYIRSYHNANPFTIHFVSQLKKNNIPSVLEIPTYPYDKEYDPAKINLDLKVDTLFRNKLAKELAAIVTFSDEEKIFGQKTIRISNGIDFSSIKMKKTENDTSKCIHLIGVAEIHFWHGFDRVVKGLADYYSSPQDYKVYFHIVGNPFSEREEKEVFRPITELGLDEYVILHGAQHGENLDALFDKADLGIGSLGRHRSNITYIKTLKNREYAARGIPFIYSEMDSDFDDRPYVLKVPPTEAPINISEVIKFFHSRQWNPSDIRNSIQNLSWENQMEQIIQYLVKYKKEF